MDRSFKVLTVVSLLAASSTVFAGSDSGFYVGGSMGTSTVDYSEAGFSFDDTDTAYKVFAGYNFGLVPFLNLAVEGGYVDFGSHQGLIGNLTGNSIDSSAFTALGLVGFDMGPVGLFGKAGMFAWDSDLNTPNGSASESGTDPAYGIGAKFQLGSFAVRAEYELFDLDDLEIDLITVGAAYTF